MKNGEFAERTRCQFTNAFTMTGGGVNIIDSLTTPLGFEP